MPVVNDKNGSGVNNAGNERGLGLSHTRRPARLVNQNSSVNNTEITEELGDISNAALDTMAANVTKVVHPQNSTVIKESDVVANRSSGINKESVANSISSSGRTVSSTPVDVSEDVTKNSPLEESLNTDQNKRNREASNKEADNKADSSGKPELAPPLIPDREEPATAEKQQQQEAAVSNSNINSSDAANLEIIRNAKVAANEIKKLEDKAISVRKDDTLWIRVASTPSNNKVFDSNDSVFYRKFTYGDYEDINNADLPLRDRYALSLQGMRVDTLDSKLLLPFCDFSYINVLRRLESQGTRKFSIPYTCNTCGQIGAYTFTLDKISFNTCDLDMPIRVRFRSYPDEIFEFNLVTIGDILTLMDDDNYYRKEKNGDYKTTVSGNLVVDRLAVLCSACTNHKYRDAYNKLNQISNDQDFRTLTELRRVLNPGLSPMKFKCSLYLPKHDDPEKIEQENEEKLDALRDSKGELPAFMKLVRERRSNKVCGAENTVNIEGGDVLVLPFREYSDDNEYGILSQQV